MCDSSSEHSDSEAGPESVRPNIRFLPPDVDKLRSELINLLKRKQLDSQHFIALVQPYGDEVVQKALPYVMKRLIEKKDKDQTRAAVLREAIQNLENDHDFRFNWNPLYESFLKGRPIPKRTTEADLSCVKAFFGDNYRKELELGTFRGDDEAKCSKLRELKPLVLLVEQLNLEVGEVKAYILAVRDARLQQKRRGRLGTVTGGDLQLVKEELQNLAWTTLKRPRTSFSAPLAKKAKLLSKEFIEDSMDDSDDIHENDGNDDHTDDGGDQDEPSIQSQPLGREPTAVPLSDTRARLHQAT